MTTEQRQHERFPYRTAVKFGHPERPETIRGLIEDVSTGGMRIVAQEQIETGRMLRLEFEDPDLGIMSEPGMVVWQVEQDDGWHHGVSWFAVGEKERQAWDALIERLAGAGF